VRVNVGSDMLAGRYFDVVDSRPALVRITIQLRLLSAIAVKGLGEPPHLLWQDSDNILLAALSPD
jgi:hypothetical protein